MPVIDYQDPSEIVRRIAPLVSHTLRGTYQKEHAEQPQTNRVTKHRPERYSVLSTDLLATPINQVRSTGMTVCIEAFEQKSGKTAPISCKKKSSFVESLISPDYNQLTDLRKKEIEQCRERY